MSIPSQLYEKNNSGNTGFFFLFQCSRNNNHKKQCFVLFFLQTKTARVPECAF